MAFRIFLIAFFIHTSYQLNNGLGRTPQMGTGTSVIIVQRLIFLITGWNSWYGYQCQPNETVIQLTTDIIVVTGLAAVGYEYGLFFYWILYDVFRFYIVNLDDCWQINRIDDNIQADPQHFPSGIRALADYIHSKNLKFGLSSGTIINFIHFDTD